MPTSENAKLEYEASQNVVGMTALTDQGDQTEFKSAATLWSNASGYAPDIKPNGLATGGAITTPASGSNDVVDIAACTVYLAGVLTSVGASTDESITRPSVSNYQKFSITVNSGGSIAVVDGSEGSSFSTTRGASGGPPWIPTTSVELGQIWLDSQSAAVITADEIKQIQGDSMERYDYPTWDEVRGEVNNGILGYAGINFHAALPVSHSDDAGSTSYPKKVYASYSTPQFAEIVDAYDFVPPALSHSVTSKQVYGRTKGSTSQSINQGTFSAEFPVNGISDGVISHVDKDLWFRFYQDENEAAYILCQGKLGASRQFPAGENVFANFTVSAETAASNVV